MTGNPRSFPASAPRRRAKPQPAAGWRLVEDRLRRAIEQDEVGIGAQIPTEAELMETFSATRYAVRRAMNNLQKDGLIRIEQGRGTFVHDSHLVSYKIGKRARFSDVLIENQITPAQEILRIEAVPASDEVAHHLGLRVGASALLMELLGYADGQVVKHDANYFPLPRFKGFEEVLRQTGSVTEALGKVGIPDYHRKSTSIVGRLPTSAEARLLRQLPTQPIFECARVDVEPGGTPILFGVTRFSCERVRLIIGDWSDAPPNIGRAARSSGKPR